MEKILITTGGTGGHVIPAEIINELVVNIDTLFDLEAARYLWEGSKDTT